MFVDKALVKIHAGNGGDGAVSFRREKFVDRGGPDGGDGGKGGDVIFKASLNQNTLANFRHQRELTAEFGRAGAKRRMHGSSGKALEVLVPVGTVIYDEAGKALADLAENGQQVIIARGGRGGFGNAHFVSSTRQAPKVAEKGETGEELIATLELKMLADVGLVGLPNAGKSTLLSVISNAHPEIANYPFTTLIPSLGVVDIDSSTSLLFADIPGLIAGASEGKGLGDEFLRHVERNQILLHLIDIYNDDLAVSYKTIQAELKNYKKDLSRRPQIVVLTKIDGLEDEIISARLKELKKIVPRGIKSIAASAKSGQGIRELLQATKQLVQSISVKGPTSHKAQLTEVDVRGRTFHKGLPVISLDPSEGWQIKKIKDRFNVTGAKIEQFARRTDFNNFHGQQRLKDIMKKLGIMRELKNRGAKPGQTIQIGDSENQRIEY